MIHWPSFWKGFMDAWGNPVTMGFVAGSAYGALLTYVVLR
jgi:hypothetical protein